MIFIFNLAAAVVAARKFATRTSAVCLLAFVSATSAQAAQLDTFERLKPQLENIHTASPQEVARIAKEFGLRPIPADKKALSELLAQNNPDLAKSTPEREQLGRWLYFDPRLSRSGLISCNTCHNLALGGTDGVSISTGHGWRQNDQQLNSPTVYNAALNATQFYGGHKITLAQQAAGPLRNPAEMAATPQEIESKLRSIPGYVSAFSAAWGEQPSYARTLESIAIFELSLVTPSRVDAFLSGDYGALNAAELQGFRTFLASGCAECHTGVNFGGVVKEFGFDRYQYTDRGEFLGADGQQLKVPTLRNIALTAPYFHNGSVWSLSEAVESMARIQVETELSEAQIGQIIEFLLALSGQIPDVIIPSLPRSGIETIRPILH